MQPEPADAHAQLQHPSPFPSPAAKDHPHTSPTPSPHRLTSLSPTQKPPMLPSVPPMVAQITSTFTQAWKWCGKMCGNGCGKGQVYGRGMFMPVHLNDSHPIPGHMSPTCLSPTHLAPHTIVPCTFLDTVHVLFVSPPCSPALPSGQSARTRLAYRNPADTTTAQTWDCAGFDPQRQKKRAASTLHARAPCPFAAHLPGSQAKVLACASPVWP